MFSSYFTFFLTPGVQDACAIGIGAALGALTRYQIGRIASDAIASQPKRYSYLKGWHTSAINISGSFILGAMVAIPTLDSTIYKGNGNKSPQSTTSSTATTTATQSKSIPNIKCTTAANTNSTLKTRKMTVSSRTKLLLGTGFCGSFTTFSTYSVDVVSLLTKGQIAKAGSYVCLTNIGSLAAAYSGMTLIRKTLFNGRS